MPATVQVQLLDPISSDTIKEMNTKEAIAMIHSRIAETIVTLSMQKYNLD
ncbi:hypothetical protein B481_1628 [Planococcus halocryophilus Or1]|nr:hypothetical protein [Planococcus halocryophilus]EMF46889.1 hypothetical protein B481_1628 [Planococcus halocryophilus Or1]